MIFVFFFFLFNSVMRIRHSSLKLRYFRIILYHILHIFTWFLATYQLIYSIQQILSLQRPYYYIIFHTRLLLLCRSSKIMARLKTFVKLYFFFFFFPVITYSITIQFFLYRFSQKMIMGHKMFFIKFLWTVKGIIISIKIISSCRGGFNGGNWS